MKSMADTHPISSPSSSGNGKWLVALIVIALLVLHQDNWFWTDGRLVFGFMPVALFYHACISIAAACTWFLATKVAWPVETIQRTIEQVEEEAGQ